MSVVFCSLDFGDELGNESVYRCVSVEYRGGGIKLRCRNLPEIGAAVRDLGIRS